MAEVTYHRIGELLRGLFEVLMPHADGLPAGEAIAATAAKVAPTAYEQTLLPKGERRYDNIIRWMTVDCVKAGWLVKSHGRWSVTDDGRAAHAEIPDPAAFYKRANQLYTAWRKSTSKAGAATLAPQAGAPADDGGDKSAAITFDQADEQAWSEIERHLTTMDPYELQDLVAALLTGMGYHIGWVAPKGKDGGVDVIAFDDPLGTRPPRIKVQVKRQQQKVDVSGLRAFMAVLSGDDAGIFVNTGGFTEDAKVEARTQHTRRVTLIDLERLVDLWTDHYPRLDERARRRMPLRPIYFLAPEG
jgi:restriction system protein